MNFNKESTPWQCCQWILKNIMRTILFLFVTVVFAIKPDPGFSQVTQIEINSDMNVSIEQLFELIEKEVGYDFFYNSAHIENAPIQQLKRGKVKVAELLQKSLATVGCSFKFNGDTVVVQKKKGRKKQLQETFTISGRVTDEEGNPIIGAAVVISKDDSTDSTASLDLFTRGTETDIDGNFTLKVALGETLSVFYLGYIALRIKIEDKRTDYQISLKKSVNTLDEVVLTGYTNIQKEKSVAAASKITKRDINRQKAINLSDRLEGISPGLLINPVSPPGGQRRTEITLRGISTFDSPNNNNTGAVDALNSLNRQPLVVLDGFPYEGPLNDIDPQTIETIDILRDAAATTLWGIRASNGVIVITTKRGRGTLEDPTISISSNLTIGTTQNLNQLSLASAAETIAIYSNALELDPNNQISAIFDDNSFAPGLSFINLNPFEQIWADFFNPNGGISETERDTRLQQLSNNNVLRDFEKFLLAPGLIRENSLSIQGGAPNATYSFTVTHVNEDRPDLGDQFRRLNLSLTTNFEISQKLRAVLDVSLTSSKTNDNGIGTSALTSGNILIFDRLVNEDGSPRDIRNVYTGFQDEFLALGFEDSSFNPILDQRLRDNETTGFNLRMAAGLNYNLFDWLTADIRYQYNKITDITNNNNDVRLFETRINNNNFITVPIGNGNNFVQRDVPFGGTLERSVNNTVNTVARGSLNFNKNFNEAHTVSALLGMEISENKVDLTRRTFFGYNDRTGVSDTSFDPRNIDSPLPGFAIPSFLSGFIPINFNNTFQPEILSRAISTFGNIGYSYKSKYNLNLSGKIDQTTAFGINQRLSKPLLWAIGGSWNIAKEGFFKPEWVNSLKLRGSYGVNGNLRRGQTTAVVIGFDNNNFVNDRDFARIVSSGNPNLTFEETTTINLGIDFGLFNNRLQGSLDVYDRQSENLLVPFNINETFGQSGSVLRNNGSISNQGVEFNVNIDFLRNTAVTWNANFNIAYNKNEVLSFSRNTFTDSNTLLTSVENGGQQLIGEDISSQLRYEWAGLDAQGNPQVFDENGEIRSFTENTPSIDALVTTKPFVAPGFGGYRNTINYKGFSLSFLAAFKFGHVFQESLDNKFPSGESGVFHSDVANAWKLPGDQLVTDIPALPTNIVDLNSQNRRIFFTRSNYRLQNAAFVRLRDVTLGYTLNNRATESIGLRNVRFTFQARNLGIIWRANDLGLDPESIPFSTQDFSVNDSFPQAFRPGILPPLTLVFGVNLNF